MDREALRRQLLDLGFDAVGFAPAGEVPDHARLLDWLAAGHQASMSWMDEHADLRRSPRELLPAARSAILVLQSYHDADLPAHEPARPGRGRVSRYARGRDYHKTLRKRLERAADLLRVEHSATSTRVCVDSAPLLERSLAAAAGLGWIGKNTMLINEKLGSYTFLGALLCDLDIAPDSPAPARCGQCRACLEACPTGALLEPGVLDSRRCISYLSIEHKGEIEPELAAQMEDHLFGCDLCQEACPWNRRAAAASEPDFRARPELVAPLLGEILALDDAAFLERFAGTPLMRAGRERLQRNARIARANEVHPGAPEES